MALKVLFQVNEKGAYSDVALARALADSSLGRLDRSLVTELVNGSVKYRLTLDWVLNQYLRRGLGRTPAWVRNILRLASYQILYLNRIPASAACDTAVELTKRYAPQAAGTVNAVLRRLVRIGPPAFPSFSTDPVTYLSLKYSHPAWMVRRWLQRWGREWTEALLEANNRRPPLAVRINTLKAELQAVAARLRGQGEEVWESAFVPEGLILGGWSFLERRPELQEGQFVFQDEGSMLVGHALSPLPQTLVVDACAGQGTKTTHLAQLTHDRADILAVDRDPVRLVRLREACARLGIGCVRTRAADARRLRELLDRPAAFVLVDAPCSGLGVLRRRADARWRKTPQDVAALPRLQLQLLEAAQAVLAPGGVLVYSTCTVEPEENQEVVAELCRRHNDLVPEDLTPYLPKPLTREEDRRQAQTGQLQLYPHLHGTDGFFIARLRKR
ncbi:MAG: 16S rRNA (cytosine(967)-C(5))-methyltransferase RsmB [Moorellales bacterium]